MRRWLEHLIVQWLVNRGYTVLPHPFVGMVVGGNAVVHDRGSHFEVSFPVETSRIRPIILTGSMLRRS